VPKVHQIHRLLLEAVPLLLPLLVVAGLGYLLLLVVAPLPLLLIRGPLPLLLIRGPLLLLALMEALMDLFLLLLAIPATAMIWAPVRVNLIMNMGTTQLTP
jgi:hypothetical protein